MTYTPNADDTANPTDGIIAETAQLEFRTLKSKINAMLGTYNGSIGSAVFITGMVLPSPVLTGSVSIAAGAVSGILTAPTAAYGTNTNQVATMAALYAAMLNTAFPTNSANNGLFLTTVAGLAAWVSLPGQKGAASSGSVILTSSSAGSQVITTTAPGQYVTLPAANSGIAAAACNYNIKNAGPYQLGIKDGAGNQLGWIRPYDSSILGCADITTIAGIWNYSNLSKIGLTAQFNSNAATQFFTGSATPLLQTIKIDSTRTLFLYSAGQAVTSTLWGQVYDSANTTPFGALTSIRTGVYFATGIAQGVAQVLVCSCDNSTAFKANVLSFGTGASSTTITVNAAVSKTISGAMAFMGNMVAVGSAYCIIYSEATTTTGLLAITVAGTVPTIGTEVTTASTSIGAVSIPQLYVSGSTLRTIMQGSSTTGIVQPYTITGTTFSAGTPANFTCVSTGASIRTLQLGNGNILIFLNNGGSLKCFDCSLSGTTETIASVSGIASGITSSSNLLYTYDVVRVSNNTVAYFWGALTSGWGCNILTDTAGTPTIGTPVTGFDTAGTAITERQITILPINGTTASFSVYMQDSTPNYIGSVVYSFNCSAASPVLLSSVISYSVTGTNLGELLPIPMPTDFMNNRQANMLYTGNSTYCLNNFNSILSAVKYNPQDIRNVMEFSIPGVQYNYITSNVYAPNTISLTAQGTWAPGFNGNDVWQAFVPQNTTGSFDGMILTKYEAVQ